MLLTWPSKPQVARLLVLLGLVCSSWTWLLSYANVNYELEFVLTSPLALKLPVPACLPEGNLSGEFGELFVCLLLVFRASGEFYNS